MVAVTSQKLRMVIGADEIATVGRYLGESQVEALCDLDGVVANIPK